MYHMQFSFVFLSSSSGESCIINSLVRVYGSLMLKLHFVEFKCRSEYSFAAMLAARNSLLVFVFLLDVCFLTVQILNY